MLDLGRALAGPSSLPRMNAPPGMQDIAPGASGQAGWADSPAPVAARKHKTVSVVAIMQASRRGQEAACAEDAARAGRMQAGCAKRQIMVAYAAWRTDDAAGAGG